MSMSMVLTYGLNIDRGGEMNLMLNIDVMARSFVVAGRGPAYSGPQC